MESRVERGLQVGRQDREAAIGLHPLQQIGDLDIGVAVVTVLHLAAFAEQRVGLVEQQHRAAVLRRVEHAPQVLLGLPDVLADDRREVDAIEVEAEFLREHLGRQGLSGAALAAEQHGDAESAFAARRKAPVVVHAPALAHLRGNLVQNLDLSRRQNEIVPARRADDPRREIVERIATGIPAGLADRGGWALALFDAPSCLLSAGRDRPCAEPVLRGDDVEIGRVPLRAEAEAPKLAPLLGRRTFDLEMHSAACRCLHARASAGTLVRSSDPASRRAWREGCASSPRT